MNAKRRAFTAAREPNRCKADIKLRDGSGAQCMRAAKIEGLCAQHYKVRFKSAAQQTGSKHRGSSALRPDAVLYHVTTDCGSGIREARSAAEAREQAEKFGVREVRRVTAADIYRASGINC